MVRSVSGILLLACSFMCMAQSGHYKMGAGDLINISIYDEPDPLLGDVEVSGLSPKALEQKLTSGLKGPYLIDPSVTVSIVEYRPFYITGEVEKPGSYAFHPGLTVDKAITISGGFTERASKGSIFVMQDQLGSDEKKQKKEVELFNTIQPGDVLTVEQSFF